MDMLDKARPQALQRSTVTDVISVLRIGRGHVAPSSTGGMEEREKR